jgi:hypothetical protein
MRLAARAFALPAALGLELAGYAGAPRFAATEMRTLEGCVLRAVDETGGEAFVIGLDLLFAGPELTRRLSQALAPAAVLVAASHSHSAPATDPGKPRLGAYAAGWTRAVGDRVLAAAEALRGETPSGVALGQAQAPLGLSINRRLHWPGPSLGRSGVTPAGARMAPNPDGPRADLARVAVASDAAGRPAAVIWSWACHATSPLPPGAISSDYPGAVRAGLRAVFGDLPVLFLQGFAGDVRPPGRPPSLAGRALALARGPRFTAMDPPRLAAWEEALAVGVTDLASQALAARAPLVGRVRGLSETLPLSAFLAGAPPRGLAIGLLELGRDLRLAHLAAEPSAAHADRVAEILPGAWAVGYAGDVFGYLPTDAQVPEGGYEVDGYMKLFAMTGRYVGSIDQALAAVLGRLADA